MHQLSIDLDDEFDLIGIHSPEEDYRVAYLMNKYLGTEFTRFSQHLDFQGSDAKFPIFEFKNDAQFINYYLINNKYIHVVKGKGGDLFAGDYTTTVYLVPEKKNVDYFLKIEGMCNAEDLQDMISELNSIHQVITSYQVNPNALKSKNHLIF